MLTLPSNLPAPPSDSLKGGPLRFTVREEFLLQEVRRQREPMTINYAA